MSHGNQLKDLAIIVNGGLTDYIAIRKAAFREAATPKSFLKNLFGVRCSYVEVA